MIFLQQKHYEINSVKYVELTTEIKQLVKAQKRLDTEYILHLWKQKNQFKYFELQHPFKNIKTRAVGNIQCSKWTTYNFVFMLDDQEKYPWIMIQNRSFIDAFIVDNVIYYTHHKLLDFDFPICFEQLKKSNLNYSFQDIEFGFTLYNVAVWHFWYEQFVYFISFNTQKSIQKNKIYFLPKRYKNFLSTDNVYLMPTFFPAGSNCWNTPLFVYMANFVYRDSIQDKVKLNKKKYDLILWLNCVASEFGTKRWLESIDGSCSIINMLCKYFKHIKIYFDGLTAYEGEIDHFQSANDIFNKIQGNLSTQINNKAIEIESLSGLDYRTKISICATVDVAIAELGSGGFIPFECCKKPGVAYGNHTYIYQMSLNRKQANIVSPNYVLEIQDKIENWDGFNSYHIPWQHIFNLLADVLSELKKRKIKKLSVPNVMTTAHEYNIAQLIKNSNGAESDLEISIKYVLNEIEKITSTNIVSSEMVKGAVEKVKTHLSFKLGNEILSAKRNKLKILILPFSLISIYAKHKLSSLVYKSIINSNPNLKSLPLFYYSDYQEALKIKNYFSYKLGEAFIKAAKNWYKGGFLKFLFIELPKLKKDKGKN